MQILTHAVPVWVSVLFLVSLPIPVVMMAAAFKKGAIAAKLSHQSSRRIFNAIILFFAVFFTYSAVMSFAGAFRENSLPPKILVYTAMPLLLVASFTVTQVKTFKAALQHMPMQTLVGIHLFRFIGIFFFISEAYGGLPTRFAYIAGIGDVATAILALFVIKAIKQKKSYARALTFGWNIFGLADIVSVLSSAMLITREAIATGGAGITEMGIFPFCLIPAFAPASIIFLHACIFRKLKPETSESTVKMAIAS